MKTAIIPSQTATNKFNGVSLVPFTEEHHAALIDILKQDDVWSQGFGKGPAAKPQTEEQFHAFIAKRINQENRVVFAVLNEEGTFVGINSLCYFNIEYRRCEIGRTIIDPNHWGKGYAGKATYLLLKIAFNHGWTRVQAEIDSVNSRSMNSFLKAGFTLEGVRRWSSYYADGTPCHVAVLSVVLPEWETVKSLHELDPQ